MEKGLVHYYFGDGKGKTTAALGLMLRSAGCEKNVVMVQFLKSTPCGELRALEGFSNVTVLRGKAGGFTSAMSESERAETKHIHEENLKRGVELSHAGGLLVLDEATDAVQLGLLDEKLLMSAVNDRSQGLEVAVTGHKPEKWLFDCADYVTEMKKHRHPFDSGVAAREGVEF